RGRPLIMSSTVVAAISKRAMVIGMPMSPKTHDDAYSTPTASRHVRSASAFSHLDDGHVSSHNGAAWSGRDSFAFRYAKSTRGRTNNRRSKGTRDTAVLYSFGMNGVDSSSARPMMTAPAMAP